MTQNSTTLRSYQSLKLDLADIIRELTHWARTQGNDNTVDRTRRLLVRLAEDRFNLTVAGQFSRGKSTLMNAILGYPFLPTGPRPTTSAITSVRYGDRPRVLIFRENAPLATEVPLEELERYVSETSKERKLRTEFADVQLPAEILRLGFCFVDTPGIGSVIASNNATTRDFLPEIDAAVFVTSFDAPLSQAELDLIDHLHTQIDQIFFVVNKADLVEPAEREEVLEFIRARIAERTGSAPRLFAVSALEGLEARTSLQSDAAAASGIVEIEQALVSFLTDHKARELLVRTAVRARSLAESERIALSIASSPPGSERAAQAEERFAARLVTLRTDQRTILARLRDRLEHGTAEMFGSLAGQWRAELERLLIPEVASVAGNVNLTRFAASEFLRACSQVESRSRAAVADWLDRNDSAFSQAVVQFNANDVLELVGVCQQIEPAWYDAFDLQVPESTRDDLSDLLDLQPSHAAPSEFSLRSQPAWWYYATLARFVAQGIRRRLTNEIERGIDDYCDALLADLISTTQGWLDHLGTKADAIIKSEVTRLRSRAGKLDPAAAGGLAVIEERLRAFLAELPRPRSATEPAGAESALTVGVRSDQPWCVVCRRVEKTVFEYLATYQGALARSEQCQRDHAQHGGFCKFHTWRYAELTSDIAISAAYSGLATAKAQALRDAAQRSENNADLHDRVVAILAADRCPACAVVTKVERAHIDEISDALRAAEPEIGSPTPSLCVTHAETVLALRPGLEQGRALLAAIAHTLERGAVDMRTYALKREALRAKLVSKSERDAHLHVLSVLEGYASLAKPTRPRD